MNNDVINNLRFISLHRLSNIDLILIFLALLLSVIGLAQVFASTYFFNYGASDLFFNQIIFIIVGFSFLLILSTINIKKLLNDKFLILALLILLTLLVAVLVLGTFAFEARRWLSIGNFTIQPSEFTKLLVLILASRFFYNIYKQDSLASNKYLQHEGFLYKVSIFFNDFRVKNALILSFVTLLTILVFLQKSLGNTIFIVLITLCIFMKNIKISKYLIFILIILIISTLLSFRAYGVFENISQNDINLFSFFFFLFCGMVFIFKRVRLRQLHIIFCLLVIFFLNIAPILTFGYNNLLQPFQRERIEAFFDNSPEKARTSNYNRDMSHIAYTSGGWIGNGYMQGRLTNSGYLPFAYTDFAFASFVEQMGLIWGAGLIVLFYLLLHRIFTISSRCEDKFLQNVAFGVGVMLSLNIFQHIGMNIGIMPITGVPLPFLSYGGSALLAVFLGLGMVSAIDLYNKGLSKTVDL
jgi:cell division protein FtsW (lipid II flippase)